MPRQVDVQARREEVLGQAFSLFAQRGFHALGMRELAASLKVTTGLLYHYFENKPELFRQAVRLRVERQIVRALERVGGAPDRSQALLSFLVEEEEELVQILRVGLEYRHADPEAGPFIHEMLERYELALGGHLGLSEEQSRQWVNLTLGILTRRLLDAAAPSMAEQLRPLTDARSPGGVRD